MRMRKCTWLLTHRETRWKQHSYRHPLPSSRHPWVTEIDDIEQNVHEAASVFVHYHFVGVRVTQHRQLRHPRSLGAIRAGKVPQTCQPFDPIIVVKHTKIIRETFKDARQHQIRIHRIVGHVEVNQTRHVAECTRCHEGDQVVMQREPFSSTVESPS